MIRGGLPSNKKVGVKKDKKFQESMIKKMEVSSEKFKYNMEIFYIC
jgi:hypothetical protein